MDCQAVADNELHERYILGRLEGADKQAFEEHLRECAECKKDHENQRKIIAGIRSVGIADMKAEIRQQTTALESGTSRGWGPLLKVAAVLFVVVGTSSVYFIFRDRGENVGSMSELAVPSVRDMPATLERKSSKEKQERDELAISPPRNAEQSAPQKEIHRLQKDIGRGDLPKPQIPATEERVKLQPNRQLVPDDTKSQLGRFDSTIQESESSFVTLRGKVTDENGQPLPGANVLLESSTKLGAASNKNGEYELTLPADSLLGGEVTLVCQFIGYQTKSTTVVLSTNSLAQDFTLAAASLDLDAVRIVSTSEEPRGALPKSLSETASDSTTLRSAPIALGKTYRYQGLREVQGVAQRFQQTLMSAEKKPKVFEFQSNGDAIRVRLRLFPEELAQREKAVLAPTFPVTIIKRQASLLEMEWQLPSSFSTTDLEAATIESLAPELLRVVLKDGHIYTIDLRRDSTEAKLQR